MNHNKDNPSTISYILARLLLSCVVEFHLIVKFLHNSELFKYSILYPQPRRSTLVLVSTKISVHDLISKLDKNNSLPFYAKSFATNQYL